jgi:hypothetical protein
MIVAFLQLFFSQSRIFANFSIDSRIFAMYYYIMRMYQERQPLYDKAETAARIKELIRDYHGDLDGITLNGQPVSSLSMADFFDFVKNIKYRIDPKPIEVIARPAHILKYRGLGMDCKKKAILCGAYCKCNGIKYRFIGSSRRPDKKVHHIFPQIYHSGQWVNYDATYPENEIGDSKQITHAEVL